ncbi:MAG: hypothetical protein HY088_01315 [Ignavibacteriales bacterium]|nr:hypothetical protein [Ignavibacteriales bacterium]
MNPHRGFIVALLFVSSVLKAQQGENELSVSVSGVGFRIGYANTYNSSKINDHIVLSAFTDIALGKEFLLNIRGEYFRTQNQFWTVTFQDPQGINVVQGPFSWSNVTLGVGLLERLSSISAVGAGVGLEWITVHDVRIVGTSFTQNNASSNEGMLNLGRQVSRDESIICPSLYFMTTMSWPMPGGVVIGTEFQYKFNFVGKYYGHSAINSINTFGASFGVKYVLD